MQKMQSGQIPLVSHKLHLDVNTWIALSFNKEFMILGNIWNLILWFSSTKVHLACKMYESINHESTGDGFPLPS